MAKPKEQLGPKEPGAVPSLPSISPVGAGTDLNTWVINSLNRIEGTLGRLEATVAHVQTQIGSVDTKLTEIEKEVAGQGKLMHTLKVFATGLAILIGWLFVNAFWPWLRTKLGIPSGP